MELWFSVCYNRKRIFERFEQFIGYGYLLYMAFEFLYKVIFFHKLFLLVHRGFEFRDTRKKRSLRNIIHKMHQLIEFARQHFLFIKLVYCDQALIKPFPSFLYTIFMYSLSFKTIKKRIYYQNHTVPNLEHEQRV